MPYRFFVFASPIYWGPFVREPGGWFQFQGAFDEQVDATCRANELKSEGVYHSIHVVDMTKLSVVYAIESSFELRDDLANIPRD